MAIVQMTIGEAREKGYKVVGAVQPYRDTPPSAWETANIIGREVVPALVGGILFGLPGGAAGSAAGNYFSQQYRIERGLQDEVGLGELGVATALGGLPMGQLKSLGTAARTGVRATQGAGLATAELYARTHIDEGRAPTRDEIASTLLFGGVFGGGLGALEAKFLSKNLGEEFQENMTRPKVREVISKGIKEKGGVENASVGNNVLAQMDLDVLAKLKNTDEMAEQVLQLTENMALRESDNFVRRLANAPVSDDVALKELSNIQNALDASAQQDEIFTPLMREVDVGLQKVGDNAALREINEEIAKLDHKHGKNKGAGNQRKKLNVERQRILKRNNLTLDDLEAEVRAGQMPPGRQDLAFRDHPMEQAGAPTKAERMAEEKLGSNYEKYFNIAMPIGAGGAAAYGLATHEGDDGEMKQAGVAPIMVALLGAMGLRGRSLKKFMQSPKFKRANVQAKKDPKSVEPDAIKSKRVDSVSDRVFIEKKWWTKTWDDVKELAGSTVTPISRQLKNLDKKLGSTFTYIFRQHDKKVSQKSTEFIKRAMPFMKSMQSVLKNKPKEREEFIDLLLENDYDGIIALTDRLGVTHKVGAQLKEMRKTLDDVHSYAREEGGFDVGYLEDYFPRKIKNYKDLRKFLDEDPEFRPATNDIDQALRKYADDNGINVEDLTQQEMAEITSRVIRGFPLKEAGTSPNFKARKIFNADKLKRIRNAYADPEDALETYIRRTVETVESRKLLGKVKPAPKGTVEGEGFKDTAPSSDLGMRLDIDGSIAGKIAEDFLKKEGIKFNQEDVEKLRDIIQARFSGGKEMGMLRGLKNLGYLQTMTGWGSAITQLADHAFSIHFNGLGNHFRTLLNRKDMFDFAEMIGLSNREFDNLGNAEKLNKMLDNLFRLTKLKQLDMFAKNAYMNSAWRKYHNMAKQKNGSQKLAEELRPYFGDRTDEIVQAVRDNGPSNKKPPAEVAELVFHKLLDVAPATATEVPMAYMKNPNWRIMYMLKTFTIKQLDAFRTAGVENMLDGRAMYLAGREAGSKKKQEAGARLAAKGLKDVVQIAAVFAAANAGTDVIKDLIYGRPIKRDELIENNLWKLLGINRYTYYNAKRKGAFKTFVDFLAPPTAFFDRAQQDITALAGDKEYKGAMLQGTPLDLIYWRYMGGLDKIKSSD